MKLLIPTVMQTILLIVIAVLLLCAIGCLGYLIYLGLGINHVLLNAGYDVFDIARRIRSALPWEEESENTKDNSDQNTNPL